MNGRFGCFSLTSACCRVLLAAQNHHLDSGSSRCPDAHSGQQKSQRPRGAKSDLSNGPTASDFVLPKPIHQVVDRLTIRREQKEQRMGLVSFHPLARWMARLVSSTADEVVDAVDVLRQNGLKLGW